MFLCHCPILFRFLLHPMPHRFATPSQLSNPAESAAQYCTMTESRFQRLDRFWLGLSETNSRHCNNRACAMRPSESQENLRVA